MASYDNHTNSEDILITAYKCGNSKIPIQTSFLQEMESIQNGDYEKEQTEARKELLDIGKTAKQAKADYDGYRLKNCYCWTAAINNTKVGKTISEEMNESELVDYLTGIAVLDVDKKDEDQEANKQKLITLPWVIAVGRSVGGNGLFVYIKLDKTKYQESYESARAILAGMGITAAKGQHNPNRIRYASYDPDVYYSKAPTLAPNVPIIEKAAREILIAKPEQDNNKRYIFEKIVKVKSAGATTWQEGERHPHLISVITWCNTIGMSKEYCLAMTEEICRPMMENGKDYDIASQVEDIYIRYSTEFNTKVWEDNFWESYKGKTSIKREPLIRVIEQVGGFSLYRPDKSKSYILIRARARFIEEATPQEIKMFIVDYVNGLTYLTDLEKMDIIELIHRGADTYFSKAALEFLPTKKIPFLRHTKESAFYPFKNGIVEVCAGGAKLLKYEDIDKYVWQSEVINFEISITDFTQATGCEYYKFIQCISKDDQKRIDYAISLTGYLLHTYKDPTKPFAVILGEETDNEEEGGGTGKGIFITAISKLIQGVKIDGKNFKTDKSFALQRVGLDSRYIAIEDVRKSLDFESFYSLITEGVTIERKNKDEIFIPYEESPKIIFTTNYTITRKGNHGKRRQKVLEFGNFFHPGLTPEDHFGHRLFNDWPAEEWNRFYNLLFLCVGIYLADGILEVDNSESNKRKQIKLNYTSEFMEWWERYSANGCHEWKLFSSMYNDFMDVNDLDKKEYPVMRFKKGIDEASKVFGMKMEKRNSLEKESKNKPEYRVAAVASR